MLSDKTFAIGRCGFKIESANNGLLAELSEFLPKRTPQRAAAQPDLVVDLDRLRDNLGSDFPREEKEQFALCLNHTIGQALSWHTGYLWVDAAALVVAPGSVVALFGPSSSGKTTLSLGLSLSQGWQLVCEDILLVDPERLAFVPVVRPFSLRAGTAALLARVTEKCLPDELEWWSYNDLFEASEQRAALACAFVLGPVEAQAETALSTREISTGECLRQVLGFSNTLRLTGATHIWEKVLSGCRCYGVDGGALEERLAFVVERTKSVAQIES